MSNSHSAPRARLLRGSASRRSNSRVATVASSSTRGNSPAGCETCWVTESWPPYKDF